MAIGLPRSKSTMFGVDRNRCSVFKALYQRSRQCRPEPAGDCDRDGEDYGKVRQGQISARQ